jgi:PIN domain nuclease of toxin-antitoxin system
VPREGRAGVPATAGTSVGDVPVTGLLLDTHVALWWLTNERLTSEVSAAIAEPRQARLVSMATVWEVAIKQGLGRLHPPEDFVEALVDEGFELLAIEPPHTRAVRDLPHHHRDPFDRMLVAQAQVERLTLVTRDERLSRYDVRILAA